MTSEAGTCENTCRTAADIEAVVTSFNQGALILEAVQSLCVQTVLPGKIIVVDDGSTDEASIRILKELECGWESPVSSNIKSMESRLELMRYIMEKHRDSYRDHVIDAMLGIEAVSMGRLYAWEEEITDSLKRQKTISGASGKFLGSPSYGDGGMASAVRVASCFPEGWTEEKL